MVRRPGSCDTPGRCGPGCGTSLVPVLPAADGASRRSEQHEHEPDHEDDDADRDEDRDVGQPPDEQQDDSQDDHGCLQVLAGVGWDRNRTPAARHTPGRTEPTRTVPAWTGVETRAPPMSQSMLHRTPDRTLISR